MTIEELKAAIVCLHKIYYESKFLDDPIEAIRFHKHMELLFNFAGIESSLLKNNPGGLRAEDILK